MTDSTEGFSQKSNVKDVGASVIGKTWAEILNTKKNSIFRIY